MADIKVTVDSNQALVKLDRVPSKVRDQLRAVIPDIIRTIGALINSKLDSELQSRTHLEVKEQMVENTRNIYGQVETVWTGEERAKIVPSVLESGARAHVIEARNAQALSFIMGGSRVFFKRVMHPGYPGIHYTERSFNESKSLIQTRITSAVLAGAREANRG